MSALKIKMTEQINSCDSICINQVIFLVQTQINLHFRGKLFYKNYIYGNLLSTNTSEGILINNKSTMYIGDEYNMLISGCSTTFLKIKL